MLRYFLSLSLFFLMSATALFGLENAKPVTHEGTGVGDTRREAVTDALVEALQRFKGVNIDALHQARSTIIEGSFRKNGVETESFTLSAKQRDAIFGRTRGYVDTYKVLKASQGKDKSWEAVVQVTMLEYQAPDTDIAKQRYKMSVLPFYSDKTTYTTPEGKARAFEVSQKITQSVISQLTKSQRFAMIDRENQRAYNVEKHILNSGDAAGEETIRLGQRLGVDYMVVGNIAEFYARPETERSNITGQVKQYLNVEASVQYRVLVMATQQIKWSDTISFERRLVNQYSNSEIVFKQAIDEMAQELAQGVIASIFHPNEYSAQRTLGTTTVKEPMEGKKESEVDLIDGGGVVLPFD